MNTIKTTKYFFERYTNLLKEAEEGGDDYYINYYKLQLSLIKEIEKPKKVSRRAKRTQNN